MTACLDLWEQLVSFQEQSSKGKVFMEILDKCKSAFLVLSQDKKPTTAKYSSSHVNLKL